MLPFHDEPVIRENIIAKILFASCSAKIPYRENFRVYGIGYNSKKLSKMAGNSASYSPNSWWIDRL